MTSDLVYIVAGELSGDQLGAGLVSAMRRLSPSRALSFAGIGGPAMQAAGVHSLFPMRDLSVMGLLEIVPRLPLLTKRLAEAVADIISRQPALVVVIDSPGFNHRLIRKVRPLCPHTRFIQYVAPQVWAWKPERAAKLGQLVDAVMCLLPFEPPYFEAHGLRAPYVGHHAVELGHAM